jgi:hypothetical protein
MGRPFVAWLVAGLEEQEAQELERTHSSVIPQEEGKIQGPHNQLVLSLESTVTCPVIFLSEGTYSLGSQGDPWSPSQLYCS